MHRVNATDLYRRLLRRLLHWILLSSGGVRSPKILIRDENVGPATVRFCGVSIQTPITF